MSTNTQEHYGLQLAGDERTTTRAGTSELLDPSTNAVMGIVSLGDAADVDEAVAAAKAAFDGVWGATLPVERGRLLNAIAAAIRANAEMLSDLVMRNAGHQRGFAVADAENAAKYFEYYAGLADKIHG